jgi:hypothetical protein
MFICLITLLQFRIYNAIIDFFNATIISINQQKHTFNELFDNNSCHNMGLNPKKEYSTFGYAFNATRTHDRESALRPHPYP